MGWTITDSGPIWVQLHEQLMQRISAGVYPKGSRLPTVRELAAEAGVNPNTMQRALAQLEADGLVVTNRTAGRTVTEDGEVLSRMCRQLAREQIQAYFDGMERLGFTRQQAIAFVQNWKEEEK
ncbi:MAG TPA: GntR family transcriptional regulator [Candidatus Enterenecus avicola]|nr:GntR family transcriptional regulator [Candidatus Enterenecus avicola]